MTNEPPEDTLFRVEALQEYARVRSEGRLLRIHPAWTGWVFLLLVATFAGALAFVWILKLVPSAPPAAIHGDAAEPPANP